MVLVAQGMSSSFLNYGMQVRILSGTLMEIYCVEKIRDGIVFDTRYYQSPEALEKGLHWHGLPYTQPKLIELGYTHKVWKLIGEEVVND